ncbi:hypothetical protein HCN44_004086 [Aphidius gifuensis]|uniref:Gustatory receptor n=1 Tax=Aphidius gifuensis TaxID=684658 RepID=A0A834Y0E4_APHGI|nr:hypothetical protein HCN44_004086 [Aphidius gifuensis]
MSRLSIYFLVGIAALGFIGIAESTGSSCRFCVQDLIDALKCHKYCNVRKLCDLLQRYMRYKATLTASVIAEIVRFSCSSDCGDGFVATTDLISLSLPELIVLYWNIIQMCIILLFIIQYSIVVTAITARIRNLNSTILAIGGNVLSSENISVFTRHSKLNLNRSDVIILIASTRRSMAIIYNVITNVEKFYSIPILCIMPYYCCAIIYSSFYLVIPITLNSNQTPISIFNSVMFVVAFIVPIIILTKNIDKLNDKFQYFGELIHKLLSRSAPNGILNQELKGFVRDMLSNTIEFSGYGMFSLDGTFLISFKYLGELVHKLLSKSAPNGILNRELKQFARDMLVNDIEFSGYGMFPLDGSFLLSLLGVTVTYLIILTQLT